MEFQFGTNWAAFSRYAGSVIGQTLAMEGLFAFFLESSFLGLLVFGEQRLGRRGHFLAALALFAGSWLSGYFIICTNAFMQDPVGYAVDGNGVLYLADFWAFVLSPWAIVQYAHTMVAAVVTASFVMAAVGAYFALQDSHHDQASRFLRVGVIAGVISLFPVMLRAIDDSTRSLTAYNASSPPGSLKIAFSWWIVGFPGHSLLRHPVPDSSRQGGWGDGAGGY
jgi:cytochrome d ubiquinol oxidase subunit I